MQADPLNSVKLFAVSGLDGWCAIGVSRLRSGWLLLSKFVTYFLNIFVTLLFNSFYNIYSDILIIQELLNHRNIYSICIYKGEVS